MMASDLISVSVENRGFKRVYGNLLYNYKVDPAKIIVSIGKNEKRGIDLNLLFPPNHKIKKIFLLKIDDYYFLIGHIKEDKVTYNISFAELLLNLDVNDSNKESLKGGDTKFDSILSKVNFFLDKICEKGIDSLNLEEKRQLNYLSKKID